MLPEDEKRKKCTDCSYCQMCNKNKCRLCAGPVHIKTPFSLKPGFTHGEYLEWKKGKTISEKG